eukprot:scaffold7892_cov62-Phaeocystis_antarctica.AAC.10
MNSCSHHWPMRGHGAGKRAERAAPAFATSCWKATLRWRCMLPFRSFQASRHGSTPPELVLGWLRSLRAVIGHRPSQ